jgi:hypothetical protein
MADVLAMPGALVAANVTNKGADETVVGRLEELVALAREGKIRAFAYAFVDRGNATFTAWVSAPDEPTGHGLVSAVTFLHYEIVKEKLSDDNTKAEPS